MRKIDLNAVLTLSYEEWKAFHDWLWEIHSVDIDSLSARELILAHRCYSLEVLHDA